MEEDIAKMIAKSNLSFSAVAKTDFIRESLASKYPDKIVPQDNQGISAMMMRFFDTAEAETKKKVQQLKAEGKKFSATLDEWTSAANKRYLNLNIHFTVSPEGKTEFINLGMLPIVGKASSEALVALVSFWILNVDKKIYFQLFYFIIIWTDDDTETLKKLTDILEPARVATEKLKFHSKM